MELIWLSLAALSAVCQAVPHPLSTVEQFGQVKVLSLHGDHRQMGQFYGQSLSVELRSSLAILKDFYLNHMGMSESEVSQQAADFTRRYGYDYNSFLKGMAEGSGLSPGDCEILNAMETISPTGNGTAGRLGQCAFMAIPGSKTASGGSLIGRNYDFPAPFDRIAKFLTVTLVFDTNRLPTAIIALPGQIYCPTCINSAGVFLELNNGMPSGGATVAADRFSMLINMLQILQQSPTVEHVAMQLESAASDFSLILNFADSTRTKSYEFSSTLLGVQSVSPDPQQVFVSTNYYLSPGWTGVPEPRDKDTWMGVTRRRNLLALASEFDQVDMTMMKAIMERRIVEGGAVWDSTIYQVIFDTRTMKLLLRTNISATGGWTGIPLNDLFIS